MYTKFKGETRFELKGHFITELRNNTFSGAENDDANEHIEKVLEIVDWFHMPHIGKDHIMLRVFPISLTGHAYRWIKTIPAGSINTWADLKAKFLNKYCPP